MYDYKIVVVVYFLFMNLTKGFSLMNVVFSLQVYYHGVLTFPFIVAEFIELFVQDVVSYQTVINSFKKENLVVLNLPYLIVKDIDRKQFEFHIFVRRIFLPFNNFFVWLRII